MIAEPVLVDTGPIVAMLDKRDRYHAACCKQAKECGGSVHSCWAVLTEAAWLLRHQPDGLANLLRMVELGDLTLLELGADAPSWITEHAKTYTALHPQLADLSLVYLAHREQVRHIFTLDRRDFLVYRDLAGEPFRLLPGEG